VDRSRTSSAFLWCSLVMLGFSPGPSGRFVLLCFFREIKPSYQLRLNTTTAPLSLARRVGKPGSLVPSDCLPVEEDRYVPVFLSLRTPFNLYESAAFQLCKVLCYRMTSVSHYLPLDSLSLLNSSSLPSPRGPPRLPSSAFAR